MKNSKKISTAICHKKGLITKGAKSEAVNIQKIIF